MRTNLPRRVLAAAAALASALTLATLAPAPALADSGNTLNVVGTSDVSDSNLFAAVLKPGFEKAYPQYQVTYQGNATQQAMNYAKTGQFGALIVHAPSLENQFVAEHYSVEPYGRAIFWGDFVLLGPASDPAGIMTNGQVASDPAAAFAKLAAAGEAGKASFIARETGSGTDVASHAIWAATTGVSTCTVAAADGGGTMPSTSTGACDTSSPTYPSWYHVTGAKQAANIQQADVCASSVSANGDDCYVFTDRGTYQYLKSTNALSSLQIVVRGSSQLLVNSFHAYAINPAAISTGSSINQNAAQAFLAWITSPAAQQAIGQYLNDGSDAPFLPDAAPTLTATSALPAQVKAGKAFSVTGTLKNVVPGTPALAHQQVSLKAVPVADPSAPPLTVATGTTDGQGRFSISYKPTEAATYSLATGSITQIENASLSPTFGDLLQPATLPLSGTVKVTGAVTLAKAVVRHRKVVLSGTIAPRAAAGAQVVLYAGHPGRKLKPVKTGKVALRASAFRLAAHLKRGTWRVKVVYVNGQSSTQATSKTKKVTVR